jgi:hypothetical protein
VLAGDTLVLAPPTPEGPHTPLIPLGGNRFRQGTGSEIVFEDSTRMIVRGATALAVTYTRVAAASVTPEQLAAYAGSYYAPELDVRWTIRADSGTLIVTRGGRRVGTLMPTYHDGFVMGSTILDFTRDGKGRPSGFLVEAGRVRHLRFAREAAAPKG